MAINPIKAAADLKKILSGINTAMKTRPNAKPSFIGNIVKGAGTGIKNVGWTNRSGYGKLGVLGTLGVPAGLIVNSARQGGMFGLNNQGDFNPGQLPFASPNALLDQQYQLGLENINKQYDTTNYNKALNDLYGALGYSEQDVAQQVANQMNQPGPGDMTDAEYAAAMNAAYANPSNEVAANYAADTGSGISGMVGNSGVDATASGDIRNLGKVQSQLGQGDRYISKTDFNAEQADQQAMTNLIPQATQALANAAIIKNQMATEQAKQQAQADLFSAVQAKKLENRGQAAYKPSDTEIQTALNEFNALKKNEQTQWVNSNLSQAELKAFKAKGWSNANIYVALRLGLV